MNYLFKLVVLLFSISAHSSEPAQLFDLDTLQWKHRIILVNTPQHQQAVLALFAKNKNEIDERDMIWFVFTGDEARTNYQGALSADFVTRIRDRYQLEPGKIMLIGKDGGVKFLLDRVDLEAIFSEIDAMPMRQNEMDH